MREAQAKNSSKSMILAGQTQKSMDFPRILNDFRTKHALGIHLVEQLVQWNGRDWCSEIDNYSIPNTNLNPFTQKKKKILR